MTGSNQMPQSTFGRREPFGSSPSSFGVPIYPTETVRSRKTVLWLSSAVLVVGAMTFASAQSQSASPFARKKTKQAWEEYSTPTDTQVQTPQAHEPSSRQKHSTALRTAHGGEVTMSNTTSSSEFRPYENQPVKEPLPNASGTYTPTSQQIAQKTPAQNLYDAPKQNSGTYYPGRTNGKPAQIQPYQNQIYKTQSQTYQRQSPNTQHRSAPSHSAQHQQSQGYNSPQYGSYGTQVHNDQRTMQKPPRRSWTEKLGFSNIATTFSGFIKGGVGATKRDQPSDDGWSEDFVLNAALRGEISAITQGGLEYGLGAELRGQYDKYRRGFGGRIGDCAPTTPGCATALVAGVPTAIRGHTSQFYTSGANNAKKAEYALEGAYLFLRSSYGDVTLGRDDGSAYLFSLGAPTLLAVGASNSSVDYTGLDSVKTVNDASGFSEKISYVSPRLLGDQIGVGVQVGVSYAPNAKACGVDYCVRSNGKDGSGVIAPDMKNVLEAGIALDRKFNNGLSIEATATYAMAKEDTNLPAFDDLKSFGLGLDLGYHDWKVGGSYLNSNNGLVDGDFTAVDLGVTWQPSKLGFTAGYGYAKDKNIDMKSYQGVFGVSYDFGNYRLGSGVQYIEREVPFTVSGMVTPTTEKATALFVEGGFTF